MISSNQPIPGVVAVTAAVPAQPSRSILLVDDEATLRSALRRFFVRRGWRVCEAEDGEQALALLLDGEQIGGGFDVVISDMRMPRLSGMALHDAIVLADARVASRFIFSSGDPGDDEAVVFLERSQCPVVGKPFELSALLALVERVAAAADATPN